LKNSCPRNKPGGPGRGMFSHEIDYRVVVVGIAEKGPAARAESSRRRL